MPRHTRECARARTHTHTHTNTIHTQYTHTNNTHTYTFTHVRKPTYSQEHARTLFLPLDLLVFEQF